MSPSRKCSASKADGRPCQAWAMVGSRPPLCNVHARSRSVDRPKDRRPADGRPADGLEESAGGDSFYRVAYTLEEVTDLLNQAMGEDLSDELGIARVAIRRIMRELQAELSPAEFARLASLIFTGINSVARLLQARRSLAAGSDEKRAKFIAQGLDEVSRRRGIKL